MTACAWREEDTHSVADRRIRGLCNKHYFRAKAAGTIEDYDLELQTWELAEELEFLLPKGGDTPQGICRRLVPTAEFPSIIRRLQKEGYNELAAQLYKSAQSIENFDADNFHSHLSEIERRESAA